MLTPEQLFSLATSPDKERKAKVEELTDEMVLFLIANIPDRQLRIDVIQEVLEYLVYDQILENRKRLDKQV